MKKDPLNIPNCNFSCLDSYDKSNPGDKVRLKELKKQRMERGFDETECWNLDETIAKFILPRLKVFRNEMIGYPGDIGSMEKWESIVDEMIWAFDYLVNEDEYNRAIDSGDSGNNDDNDEYWHQRINNIEAAYKRVDEGLSLFAKHFRSLWW